MSENDYMNTYRTATNQPDDVILCEVCGLNAHDIYHIEHKRSVVGTKMFDDINNMIALCEDCHDEYCEKSEHKKMLRDAHKRIMGLIP